LTSSTDSFRVSRTAEGKAKADEIIRFIEKLTIPSGKGQGKPFRLRPFQKRFIKDIYESRCNGKRVVRRAVLSLARKNGKTCLIAAIVLVHLVGPAAEPNGEIYSVANDRDQASIIYKFAKQMIELEPDLLRRIEIIPSTKTMLARQTGSVYRAVSSESGTKHGYLPSLVIYDELAQAKNRDLYDVFDTSFGAREEPLFIAISTQSNDPEHIMSQLIDDGLSKTDPTIVCHLHAADENCELDDPKQWKKANPALGDFRNRDDLVLAIKKAIRMPASEPAVRNLFLNQRVAPVSTLISRAEWKACAGVVSFEDREEVYLALDLASTVDLAALIMGSANDPCRIRPFFWKPLEHLREHSNRDFGSGNLRYLEWANAGYLRTSPGKSIDPGVIATTIAELSQRYRVLGVAFDRWRIEDLLREFDRIGLQAYKDSEKGGSGLRLVPWGQGFVTMGPSVDALELAILERKLVHPDSPVLNFNISNAVAVMDPAGNRKIDKSKARFRIDGAVALAMLMGLRSRDGIKKPLDVETMIF